VPIDNIEHAVGAFINMLVSRLEFGPKTTLLDVITKVQMDFIEAIPHQHCSLAQFQHDLGLSGKPLFNTAVSIQNHGTTDPVAGYDLDVEFEQLDGHDPSEFVMTVNIDATRNDETVRFTYWSDAITDGDAKNVSTLMSNILCQALENTKQPIAELVVFMNGKSSHVNGAYPSPGRLHSSISRTRSSASRTSSYSSTSPTRTPHINFPDLAPPPPSIPAATSEISDWGSLIRSIVNEIVPRIVEQIVARNQTAINMASTTFDHTPNQKKGILTRRPSKSGQAQSNMDATSLRETARPGSAHARRLSLTSNAESRIQTAADMVAAVGVLATEVENGVAPDYVEKKLLALWSELLESVQETVKQDDSFFVS